MIPQWESPKNSCPDPLTCIHVKYTLSNTPEGDDAEVDKVIVKNFLNTLAEVALSIASREVKKQ